MTENHTGNNVEALSPITLPDIATCPLSGNWVKGEGSEGALVMLVGEAPGEEEARRKRPFVGKSGQELNMYLEQFAHLHRPTCYVTNLVKVRPPDNRDPLPEEIEWFSPFLLQEIRTVQPQYIGAIGRYSAGWFRGRPVQMEKEHGIPFTWGRYETTVVPLYHPAFGLHNTRMMQQIIWDFRDFGEIIRGSYALVVDHVGELNYKVYR